MPIHWKCRLPDEWNGLIKGGALNKSEHLAREIIQTYSAKKPLRNLKGEVERYHIDQFATPSQILTKLKREFAHDASTWLREPVGPDQKTTGEHLLAFFEEDLEMAASKLMKQEGIDAKSVDGIELRAYIYKYGWKVLVDYLYGIMVLEHNIVLWT